MIDNRSYVFISGCDRSGTTAIVRLLNAHPDICIGMERYKGLLKNNISLTSLTKDRFNKDCFFNLKDEETNIKWDYFYDELKDKFDVSKYVGDKVPRYFQIYDHLEREFPSAKHLFIIRDPYEVASSWKARANDISDVNWLPTNDVRKAVSVWNKSLELAYKKMKSEKMELFFVSYSSLFSGDKRSLENILRFMVLSDSKKLNEKFLSMTKDWNKRKNKCINLTEEEFKYVKDNSNFPLFHHALKYNEILVSKRG